MIRKVLGPSHLLQEIHEALHETISALKSVGGFLGVQRYRRVNDEFRPGFRMRLNSPNRFVQMTNKLKFRLRTRGTALEFLGQDLYHLAMRDDEAAFAFLPKTLLF